MTSLTLMRGIPGSGKSTRARELAKLNNAVVIERDMLRFGLYGTYFGVPIDEDVITSIQESSVKKLLKEGKSVIISDTNLHDRSVNNFRKIAWHFGADVFRVVDMRSVPLPVAQAYNSSEDRQASGKVVPDEVLEKMFKTASKKVNVPSVDNYLNDPESYINIVEEENPLKMAEKYVPVNPEAKKIYLVDADGTLFSHEGIRSPYDTSRYRLDACHEDVADVVRTLHSSGYGIEIMSGRHQDYKDDLIYSLSKYNIPFDNITMREDPHETDSIEKLKLFEKHYRNNPNVQVVGCFDDRLQVVEGTWRGALGIRCYAVAEGDF